MKNKVLSLALGVLVFAANVNVSFAAGYSLTDLGLIGGSYTSEWGVNNPDGGSAVPLGGFYSNHAYDTNASGQVVGYSIPLGNQPYAYAATLWSSGTVSVLGTLYGGFSAARAINDSGQIVGYMQRQGSQSYSTATLWDNGQIVDLGLPGEQQSWANDVNNSGQVVGYTSSASNGGRAYAGLWDNGVFTDLNSYISASLAVDGWRIADAVGISDDGWIAVILYSDRTGFSHIGKLTLCETCQPIDYTQYASPVPLPATGVLMLSGLASLLIVSKRRRQHANHVGAMKISS